MRNCKKILLDVIYPPVCPVCRDVIPLKKRIPLYRGEETMDSFLCAPCREQLSFVDEKKFCQVCGRETENGENLCRVCKTIPRCFAGGRSVWFYNGAARQVMMSLKYDGKREFADFLSFSSFFRHGGWFRSIRPDLIVPVPVHPDKLRERGYNQAELLARGISHYTGIPVSCALERKRKTEASKELGAKGRVLNLKGAFSMGKYPVEGKRILLVDDILTTGVTMESCAEVLLYEGRAQAVYVLSACSGK